MRMGFLRLNPLSLSTGFPSPRGFLRRNLTTLVALAELNGKKFSLQAQDQGRSAPSA
jgi:hypothetical protein